MADISCGAGHLYRDRSTERSASIANTTTDAKTAHRIRDVGIDVVHRYLRTAATAASSDDADPGKWRRNGCPRHHAAQLTLRPVATFPGASIYDIGDRQSELDRRGTGANDILNTSHRSGSSIVFPSAEHERPAAIRFSRCTLFLVHLHSPEFPSSPATVTTIQVHDIARVAFAVRSNSAVTTNRSRSSRVRNPRSNTALNRPVPAVVIT